MKATFECDEENFETARDLLAVLVLQGQLYPISEEERNAVAEVAEALSWQNIKLHV